MCGGGTRRGLLPTVPGSRLWNSGHRPCQPLGFTRFGGLWVVGAGTAVTSDTWGHFVGHSPKLQRLLFGFALSLLNQCEENEPIFINDGALCGGGVGIWA